MKEQGKVVVNKFIKENEQEQNNIINMIKDIFGILNDTYLREIFFKNLYCIDKKSVPNVEKMINILQLDVQVNINPDIKKDDKLMAI